MCLTNLKNNVAFFNAVKFLKKKINKKESVVHSSHGNKQANIHCLLSWCCMYVYARTHMVSVVFSLVLWLCDHVMKNLSLQHVPGNGAGVMT